MTTGIEALLLAILGAVLAWSLLMLALRSRVASRIAVDLPNERSLHDRAVPRVGGLALVGVFIAIVFFSSPALRIPLMIAASLMIVSAIDDRRGLPVLVRLSAHVAAAVIAVSAIAPEGPWSQHAILVVALVWSMNLYNFMDGADGLAGGMAVFGLAAYAVVAELADAHELALASAAGAGAAAGFLVHNFPPARVFLGDAGAVPLGFLAAALGLVGWSGGLWSACFPLLVFAPFVIDATATLALRLLRGERVWKAHREHLYQRMVRSGLGHRGTALIWYIAMGVSAATGFASIRWPIGWQIGLLGAWTGIYACGVLAMQQRLRNPVR